MRRLLFPLLLLCACEKYDLSVRQLAVDSRWLASSHVGTPDPRLAHPPLGEKLAISWTVPPELLAQEPRVVLHILFWNHTQKEVSYPIHYRTGTKVYSLLDEEFEKTKGLLTYRAQIVTADGHVYKDWKHQLWVNLITLDSEASLTSSSVVDQSMQGSVMETAYSSSEGFSDKN